ncbi:MAG: hypothetical protein HC854_14370 [Flavobacterium sp.]|nr:hypothetical protein [Flavobacterium sp.]
MTKREKSLNYFSDVKKANKEIFCDNIIFTYEEFNSYAVAIFLSTGFKPYHHYSFKTVDKLEKYIEERKKYIKISYDSNLKRLQEIQNEIQSIKKDSILNTCWGYEQTNVEFYIVLERKNSFIIVQEIAQNRKYIESQDSGTCTPNISALIGKPLKRKITKYGAINITECQRATLWNGSEKHWISYH